MRSREEERRFTYEDMHQQDENYHYEEVHNGDIYLQDIHLQDIHPKDIHHNGWKVSHPRSRKTNIVTVGPSPEEES